MHSAYKHLFKVNITFSGDIEMERWFEMGCDKMIQWRYLSNVNFEHILQVIWHSLDGNEMLCAIRYHLYNLKNVKNAHGGVLLSAKCRLMKPASLLKVTLLHECFSRFLNCTNGNKSWNASLYTSWVLPFIKSISNVFWQNSRIM